MMQRPSTAYKLRIVFIVLMLFLTCRYIFFVSKTKNDDIETRKHLYYNSHLPCTDLSKFPQDHPQLVACLAQDFLRPPSNEPYDLDDPNPESNPSQYGQNLMALKILGNKRNGFFIECGALNGEFLSNTLFLERNYGWTGLLVEAEPNNYKSLSSKHRKAWTSHSCLSPKETAEKLTLVGIDYGSKSGGLTLMNNSVPLKKFGGYVNSKRKPVEVQCFPLYTYLLALGRTEVDYFSLDVEGADFEILKTIPFDKVIFKVLEVEVAWVNEGKEAVKTFLEQHGYIFLKEVAVDYIFVHNSVKLPTGFVL